MIDIPLWAAIPVAVLALIGSALTLLGCIGLVRLQSFYARIHAPTLGTSFGMIFMAVASMIYFSAAEIRFISHELLLIVFLTATTPVTLVLLARAALHRDRAEGKEGVPHSRRMTIAESQEDKGGSFKV
jgi:multicomponent K+:H+ antiporter subunit G